MPIVLSVCAWEGCDRTEILARGLCARCNMRARKAGRLHEFAAPPLTCRQCGNEYSNGTKSGKWFCSETCQKTARAARTAQRRVERLSARACPFCGSCVPLVARSDAIYCSVVCQQASWYIGNQDLCRQRQVRWNAVNAEAKRDASRIWYDQNRERAAENSRRWKAANPDLVRQISRQAAQTRRARKKNAFVEHIDLVEIWERDQGVCWLCQEEINPDLAHPHPMSQSLDHVVPLSRGGLHSRENVALAHLICNMRKGAQLQIAA